MLGVCTLDLSTWSSAWRDPLAAPELLPLNEAVGRVLLGKDHQVRLAFSCLLAGVFALAFKRVSFTSDLLPADLTGLNVFNPAETSFRSARPTVHAGVAVQ